MKKVFLNLIVLLCISFFPLTAQSADIVTDMISTPEVTWAQAAYFSASWLYPDQEFSDMNSAFNYLSENKIIKANINPESTVSLKQLSGLCLKTWNVKGGLMYKLTKADRYAFRELKAKSIIDSSSDPSDKVTGRKALEIINFCASLNSPSGDL